MLWFSNPYLVLSCYINCKNMVFSSYFKEIEGYIRAMKLICNWLKVPSASAQSISWHGEVMPSWRNNQMHHSCCCQCTYYFFFSWLEKRCVTPPRYLCALIAGSRHNQEDSVWFPDWLEADGQSLYKKKTVHLAMNVKQVSFMNQVHLTGVWLWQELPTVLK